MKLVTELSRLLTSTASGARTAIERIDILRRVIATPDSCVLEPADHGLTHRAIPFARCAPSTGKNPPAISHPLYVVSAPTCPFKDDIGCQALPSHRSTLSGKDPPATSVSPYSVNALTYSYEYCPRPLPSESHLPPSHFATWYAGTPPAVVKPPPAITESRWTANEKTVP